MIKLLKTFFQNHSKLFKVLRYVPYSLRLGSAYSLHQELLDNYHNMSSSEREYFHFEKLKSLIEYAFYNIEFYKEFYISHGYHPSNFKKLSDFSKVPIVTKSDLKSFELKQRSKIKNSSLLVNTGGTSGEPLAFYLDKEAFAREWAYMHYIWSKLGYKYVDAKVTFRGKVNNDSVIEYNVIHNEYVVDAYVSMDKVVKALSNLTKNTIIKYLHGYPSLIYSFCKYIQQESIDVREVFPDELKGVFLGSEYPAPIYRELIESVLGVATLSWYGHSEMSLLAYEKNNQFEYYPIKTYGYTEAIPLNKSENKLISTSYYNFDSPFIRYDTGDLVDNVKYKDDVLESFKISSGRVGDFIYDDKNNPISLTALIFGRHHPAFDCVDFIQIRQSIKGHATICITSKNDVPLSLFNLGNVNIQFTIEYFQKPYKTSAGKLPLLIP